MPNKTRPKTTSERAAVRTARKMVREIRRRGLRPGAKLFSEHVMVEKYGVARATIREALRFLELQGALRIKAGPGGGPVVSTPGADHLASVLSLHLEFAEASFSSVIDARRAIYPLLAFEAAENAKRDDLVTLHDSVARMHAGVCDLEHFTQEARRFLSLIAAASRNRVLALLVDALHRMSEGVDKNWDEKQRRSALSSYERVTRAIEAGEGEQARSIMQKSLAAAARSWERSASDELKKPVAWIDADH
ncbi:MAG: FCD domain-containing protein [Myxococcota bacterium]|nr:FCD domain-containing protein [Myxococcota bacterium]